MQWYPWGKAAINLARELDKPILLSIGYSACHWCHVMAHESFEDNDLVAIMNEHFINIKVDREERPDIDQIYQTSHSMLSQKKWWLAINCIFNSQARTLFYRHVFSQICQVSAAKFRRFDSASGAILLWT